MLRKCKKHGVTEFSKNSRSRCLICRKDAVTKRRKKLKIMSVEYKGGKCEKCGYNKCTDALDFHHVDPTQKDFGLSMRGMTRSWEKIKQELDKCILVCSNCHREIHAEQST